MVRVRGVRAQSDHAAGAQRPLLARSSAQAHWPDRSPACRLSLPRVKERGRLPRQVHAQRVCMSSGHHPAASARDSLHGPLRSLLFG